MSSIPPDLKYAKSHEWLKLEPDGTATVGISDYAQESLGDITYVQLPKVGAAFNAGETFGVVESVKAASDIYAPVAGSIVAINEKLTAAPETLNRSPYGDGWLIRMKVIDPAAVGKGLLSAADYGSITS